MEKMKGFTLEVGGTRSQELRGRRRMRMRMRRELQGKGILKRRRVPKRIHRVCITGRLHVVGYW